MNTINSYRFGDIVIEGKQYSVDVIIFPDRVQSNWWRKTGHELCLEDITGVLAEKPDVLVVGTGESGMMKVLPEVEKTAEAQGITLIAESTEIACKTYNRLSGSQQVIAALHITC